MLGRLAAAGAAFASSNVAWSLHDRPQLEGIPKQQLDFLTKGHGIDTSV